MSFDLSMTTQGLRLLDLSMASGIRKYQNAIRPQLRKAAFVLRREGRRQLIAHPDIRLGEPHNPKRNVSGSQLKRGIRVRIQRNREGELEALVGPRPGRVPEFYGKFLELGTVERATKKGARRGRVEPRPFMKPALAAKLDEVHDILGDSFDAFQGAV